MLGVLTGVVEGPVEVASDVGFDALVGIGQVD